ncbi:MAG: extracellular solute-binding protein [Chloroflexi bacterium]|nr:extracellular solute-binding protein [Chloroflexota bacterium]
MAKVYPSIICSAILTVLTTACAVSGLPQIEPTATVPGPTSVKPTQIANLPTTMTAPSPTRAPTTSDGIITLSVWMVEDVAPSDTPAGKVLLNQINAFSAQSPSIRLELATKLASGKGGLLDFLETTRAVVPARLPDVIALEMAQVPLAAGEGILQPLDSWLPADVTGDWFPFAVQAARYQNHWMAVPFAADIQHLVYNKAAVRRVPQTWNDFLSQKGTLLLPLGGDDAFLLQYLAQGVPFLDTNNQVALDGNATAQVLSFLKRAHDQGLIPESALSLKSVDQVWPGFAAGQVSMAQVSASRYLMERSKSSNYLYAPMPTREGKVATLSTGWAFAVVTSDPARQAASMQFIRWITQGEHLAPWLRADHLLPASRSAVPLAVDPPDYAGFISDELEHASSLPSASSYATQAEAWRSAIAAVWKGQMTPEQAARTAVAAK